VSYFRCEWDFAFKKETENTMKMPSEEELERMAIAGRAERHRLYAEDALLDDAGTQGRQEILTRIEIAALKHAFEVLEEYRNLRT
jgi:hypothetical protein